MINNIIIAILAFGAGNYLGFYKDAKIIAKIKTEISKAEVVASTDLRAFIASIKKHL